MQPGFSKSQYEVLTVGGLGLLVVAISSGGLYIAQGLSSALIWSLLSTGLLLWLLHCTWQRLPLNRPDEQSLPFVSLGWANRITLLRGIFIVFAGGFIWQPPQQGILQWLPGLLYLCAAILDRVDGAVARLSRQTSLLGQQLDMLFDAFGLVVAPLLAVRLDKIHWSYLLLSAAYFLFQWGLQWRRAHHLAIYPLVPSLLRRRMAGFQMGFIACVLLPLFQPPVTTACAAVFMLPVLVGFMLDWLVCSGFIARVPEAALPWARLANIKYQYFLPGLRLAFLVSLIYVFNQPVTFPQNMLLLGSIFASALCIALGFAGTLAAVLFIATWSLVFNTFTLPLYVVLTCAILIALLGTGHFSLWQGDERWLDRQEGADS